MTARLLILAHVLVFGVQARSVPLDANDVSILIPHQRQTSVPEIRLDAQTELISSEIFRQVLTFEKPNSDLTQLPYMEAETLSDRHNWKVTSIRFNPCDDAIDFSHQSRLNILIGKKKEGCQAKLRLVAQPFDFRSFPLATAVHLLYYLDDYQAQLTVDGLEKVKLITGQIYNIKTTGMPLQVHPGLVYEHTSKITNGPVANAVEELVQTVLNSKNSPEQKLKIVTMTVRESLDQWKFVGGTVMDSRWTVFTTPFNLNFYLDKNGGMAAPGKETVGVEVINCNQNNVCTSAPYASEEAQTNKNVLTQAFNPSVAGQRKALTHDERELLAEKVDQPQITTFFNTNCISCHESSNMRNKNRFVSAIQWPAGVTPFTPREYVTGKLNGLINFGYDGTIARISTRTAAETAGVVDFLNKKREFKNNGFVPSDLGKFWNCLMNQLDWTQCLN